MTHEIVLQQPELWVCTPFCIVDTLLADLCHHELLSLVLVPNGRGVGTASLELVRGSESNDPMQACHEGSLPTVRNNVQGFRDFGGESRGGDLSE